MGRGTYMVRLLNLISPKLQVVELIVTHPLVNILRGAMSILVSVVSHPHSANRASQHHLYHNNGHFGFRALRPAIAAHPQFLEMLVSRLSSADHALCANSLQLINSLMRDAIMNESDNEWPRFIKRLQDLGVIKAVFVRLALYIYPWASLLSKGDIRFSCKAPLSKTLRIPSSNSRP